MTVSEILRDSTEQSSARPPALWAGSGMSGLPDSAAAGRSAAAQALGSPASGRAKLVIVFATERHDLPRLLAGVRSVAGGTPLVGCTTAGEIIGDAAGDLGVVVMALGGDGLSVATRVVPSVSDDMRAAGAAAAEALVDVEPRTNRVLMLLLDGLAGDQQEVVRGAYAVVGAEVPLVGGAAGDELNMEKTQQLYGDGTCVHGAYDDRVLTGAVVGVAISTDGPLGIGVQHGWRHVGEPMLVTGSTGRLVHSIDDEPALDAYLRRLGAPPEAYGDTVAFSRFAITHPLGLARRGSTVVRMVAAPDFESRSLVCTAEVPQGRLAWFMEGDEESVLDATDAACGEAVAALGGSAPRALLAFDCVGRRGVLGGSGVRREVDVIARHAAGAPVAGFYTYGEVARTRGISGYHNQTLVVLALG